MVIVDTTVWVDYLSGIQTPETDWLDVEMDRQRLGLTDLILCEVLQGVRDERQFAAVRNRLARFEVFSTGGTALVIWAAKNYVNCGQAVIASEVPLIAWLLHSAC